MRTIVLACIMIISLQPLWSVNFASDCIYLVNEGQDIPDSRVAVIDARSGSIDVCIEGKYWTKQAPMPLDFTFYLTETPLLDENSFYADSGLGSFDAYQSYLKKKIEGIAGIKVSLPRPSDTSVSDSPPAGMTGGTIGSTRYFTLDLKTGLPAITSERVKPSSTSSQESAPPILPTIIGIVIAMMALTVGVVLRKRH